MSITPSGEDATGRIVTFYSYKGGTGRTMALANVAWLLASNGYRVLTIDWDLESPGLHRYFHPFLKDKELRSTDGILDLVRKYAEATSRAAATKATLDGLADIQDYAASLEWEFPQGGLIDFVAAGRQDDGYASKVSTFDWDSFWTRRNGGRFIELLRQDMRRHYDYVLIDSRTGTSDTAGICTIQLPEAVVNCFTLNKQSIDGAAAITNSILHRSNDRVVVYPIPTRIEDGEKEKLDRGRMYSRRRFAPYLTFLGDEDADAYWDGAEVPYIPYYAYEEILAAFGDKPRQENTLLARYQRLARRITGHDCPLPQIVEGERVRVRRAFEQSTPAESTAVLIAYAPLDRIWAEWLRDRLSGPAYHVTLHCVETPLPTLAGAGRLVIVHSRDYAGSDEGVRLLRVATERATAGDSHFVVAVRVDATPVDEQVPARSLIDVMGVPEERALDLLATALSLDPAEAPRSGGRETVIRYPAIQAPYWNLQLTRNPRFSGRGHLLERMRDQLLGAGPEGGRLVLTGLPGVGKTQAALEYVYRFAASYEIVWWISASQPARARVILADLGEKLGLPPREDIDGQIAAVLEDLRQAGPRRRWLIVFDNVDSPADVDELLPAASGHILVTSRNPQWADRSSHLDVNVFRREESIELLGRRVNGISPADANRLAERLGDLPLAIEQAGGWLYGTGMQVNDYLNLFDRSATDVAEAMDENAPADYTQTITSTVRVAYDELRQRHPAAARLLELFAFMAPEAIPSRLISNQRLTEILTAFDAKMHDPMRHGTLNREIGRYGLARVDSGTGGVVVHRLTQDIVRSRLSPEEQQQRREELQTVLAAADRGRPDNRDRWHDYESLRPHLLPAGVATSKSPDVRQLLIDTVRYLWLRGDYASSQELARTALDEWAPRFGADDSWTLQLNYQLAVALRNQGREGEAYEINKDSHERLSRTLGKDDPYTLMTASSLGADLRARGEYHEAKELDEETVRELRTALGDDNPITLNAVNNLGVSLRLVGDFEAAARLDRETLERRRKVLGANAPDTLTSGENYGVDLRELGELESSRNTLVNAYTRLRDNLGNDHLRTIRAGKVYAVTLRRLGRLGEADEVMDRVERSAEIVLGHSHPVTLAVLLERACVRWAQGDLEDAQTIAREVHGLCFRLRGDHHPFTLVVANDLSIFRRSAGDLEGARRLAEKTADRFESLLGPRHPNTLAALVTLANAVNAEEPRGAAALNRDETAYSRLRKALPADHPSVLAAAVNYVVSHEGTEPAAAERVRAEALERIQAALGEEHPYAVAARAGRRIDLDTEMMFT